MLDLASTLDLQFNYAQQKAAAARRPGKYLISSMLAGAFVGIAVVLMFCAAGPFFAADSPATKLVAGGVFAVGLILVVFAGAELATSAMMILTQGALAKRINWGAATGTLVFCLVGNLLGSMLFGWIVVQAGIVDAGTPAGEYLAYFLAAKSHETMWQLFLRGVLCNILVCLAIWSANRSQSEAGKAIVIFWCLLAFVTSGYEHVVANMTSFSLGVFVSPAVTTWADFGRNMVFVGLGNWVGGAIFVGVAYYVVAGRVRAANSAAA